MQISEKDEDDMRGIWDNTNWSSLILSSVSRRDNRNCSDSPIWLKEQNIGIPIVTVETDAGEFSPIVFFGEREHLYFII